jgi:DNA polymerase
LGASGLPKGTRNVKLYLDLETRSRVDLKKSNVYRYCEDPDFQFLMCWYAVDDGPLQVALDPHDIYNIPGLWDNTVEKIAHNAQFERICFSALKRNWFFELEEFEYLDPEPWTDTMALAGEHGHPRKLEELALALGGEKKDSAGTALITFFCKPNRKGQFNRPEDHPEKWQQFLEYGRQDVVVLREVAQALPGWPNEAERQAFLADQAINDTGIQVDTDLVKAAIEVGAQNAAEQTAEVTRLTGVDNPNSGPQMKAWLESMGVSMPNMQAETVTNLLAGELHPTVRRVLELRQELALVAGKKYQAALDRVNPDGRLRGSFAFFGAHTGRWSGRGVQLQNLPSATIKADEELGQDVDSEIQAAALDVLLGTQVDAHTLKALVRAMFIGPFTVVDYASIEARVLAWLASEEWALQAFRDGRDIYVETAERMGGMTRKEGKVAVLALGYNGGVNSLRAMGAEGEDYKLKKLVYQWRDANENIVAFWAELEGAFRRGDEWAGRIYVAKDEKDRQVVLPSGRAITYHNVGSRFETDQWGRRKQVITFTDPAKYPYKGTTYGGRLAENVTQAVARDVLSEALVRLQRYGRKVVGHVHDEILVEGLESVEDITKIMVESPTWADGLPLNAEGFTCPRYRKD